MAEKSSENGTGNSSWREKLLSRAVLGGVARFVAGILFAAGFNVALSKTNEMEFCISCHSMKTNYREYQETVHYKGRTGVQATCADCHVPKEFVP